MTGKPIQIVIKVLTFEPLISLALDLWPLRHCESFSFGCQFVCMKRANHILVKFKGNLVNMTCSQKLEKNIREREQLGVKLLFD